MPKGKQFDFSESQLFGKFDLFERRIKKLRDLFTAIQQFRALEDHNLEGMQDLIKEFNNEIKNLQNSKQIDLMNINNP
jgi:dynein heavy chain